MRRLGVVSFSLLALACGGESPTAESNAPAHEESVVEETAEITIPAGMEPLPEVEVEPAKMALGRALFHDTRLSGDETIACSTCHSLDHGGAEARRSSNGIREQVGPINSPTVLNSGFSFAQFWDGRAHTLEEQAAGPVANPIEMGATWEQVVERINADEQYRAQLTELYGGVSQETITHAIADYERALVTPSRYDRYLNGERDALTAEEIAGMQLFASTGCTACHRGPLLGGNSYQKLGLVRNYFEERGGEITEADLGRFNVTHDEADRHKFKVPTLRNVELTPPYLHDGSQETLPDVVRVMGRVQLNRDLNDEQVASIVAFLRALTGELPDYARVPRADSSGAEGAAPPAEPAEPASAEESAG